MTLGRYKGEPKIFEEYHLTDPLSTPFDDITRQSTREVLAVDSQEIVCIL